MKFFKKLFNSKSENELIRERGFDLTEEIQSSFIDPILQDL